MDNIGKCLHCGIKIITKVRGKEKKFCCRICKDRYGHRQEKKQYTCICKNCGKEFHPKDIRRNKYCSNECRQKSLKGRKLKSRISEKIIIERLINKFIATNIMRINICNKCGMVFYNEKGRNTKFCSQQCRDKTHSIKRHKNRCDKIDNIVRCRECGVKISLLYPKTRSKFCSNGCSKKYNKRTREIRIRAGRKNAIVDRFSLYEVLVRDGYVCGICGEQIDVSLPYNHNMAATIDHIVPLSKGGIHCWNNVQAAHFGCNSRKSNHVIE